jgi:hypothetical protein
LQAVVAEAAQEKVTDVRRKCPEGTDDRKKKDRVDQGWSKKGERRVDSIRGLDESQTVEWGLAADDRRVSSNRRLAVRQSLEKIEKPIVNRTCDHFSVRQLSRAGQRRRPRHTESDLAIADEGFE